LSIDPGERTPEEAPARLGDLELVFARAGAMAPLLRGLDWASTPLGEPATWPQSLRSAASICLGAKYPIAIYWGPELVLLYNEAWSAIPGDKHPWALGRPGREVWPDIWDIVGPEFDLALAGEGRWNADRLLPMRRRGYLEETYFNYNLSPIQAEDGRIEGVFNAGLETTARVVASRHQRVLIDLIGETASASTVDEALTGAIGSLAGHPEVAPFAVLYRFDDGVARFAGTTGLVEGGPGTAAVVAPGDHDPWRLHEAASTREVQVIEDIGRFAEAELVGDWPERAHTAVTLPVVRSRRRRRRVEGALVVGVPPGLRLDRQHEEFHAALADRLALSVLDARREEEERRVFETEHRIAATLQQSLIPALPDIDHVTLSGCYLPGTAGVEVGGDWYDAIPTPDGGVTVVIGDVVGKGVAAAAQMGQVRNALRAYVLEGFSPATVVRKLNHLTMSLSGSTFVTLLVMSYHADGHELRWCRAGHLPAMVRSADGRVRVLDQPGCPPVGVFDVLECQESRTTLEEDDAVVLYTDGLVERPEEDIDVGIDRLATRVGELATGDGFVEGIVAPLADAERRDDVAVLVLCT
jgi:serine phosphatase RsbU (regulator of sigma subunit)